MGFVYLIAWFLKDRIQADVKMTGISFSFGIGKKSGVGCLKMHFRCLPGLSMAINFWHHANC